MQFFIMFFPFINLINLCLINRFIGTKGVNLISVYSLYFIWLISFILLKNIVIYGETYELNLGLWFKFLEMESYFNFNLDSLGLLMCNVISFISMLVHLYSIKYMESDPHQMKFMIILSLFTWFMLLLVTANNYMLLFASWEGVGMTSYLLIGFWYTRMQASKSALKALLMNSIGDMFFFLGLMIIYYKFHTFDFKMMNLIIHSIYEDEMLFLNYSIKYVTLISILIFFGCISKSSQMGLHTWLPDAMEGPTPVSALIHAATMVTAGIFLVLSSLMFFEYSEFSLYFMILMGALTTLYGATMCIVQMDMKKMIAYSTCSQLGYMVLACGLSQYDVCMFHSMNHAFFKALLFLGAGIIIHSMNGEQNISKMGALIYPLYLTYTMMMIGSFSLMGFPGLSGFFSKEKILELSFSSFLSISQFSYYIGTLAAIFTSMYSGSLMYFVFATNTNSYKTIYKQIKEPDWYSLTPLMILTFFSIFSGYLLKDLIMGVGNIFWNQNLFLNFNHILFDSEYIHICIKLTPLMCSMIGLSLSFISYFLMNKLIMNFLFENYLLYLFFTNQGYFNLIYNKYIIYIWLSITSIMWKMNDKGFINLPIMLGKLLMKYLNMLKYFMNLTFMSYLSFIIFSLLNFFMLIMYFIN